MAALNLMKYVEALLAPTKAAIGAALAQLTAAVNQINIETGVSNIPNNTVLGNSSGASGPSGPMVIGSSLLLQSGTIQANPVVAITGGTIVGMAFLGLKNGDTLTPVIQPDIAWSVGDTSGNVAVAIGTDGTLYAIDVNVGGVDLTSALAATLPRVGGTLTGTLTLPALQFSDGGAIRDLPTPIPDLVHVITDATGNVIAGYDSTGAFTVQNVNVTGTISYAGLGVIGGAAPFSSVEILARDGVAAAQSMAVVSQRNTAIARPISQYNHHIGYGQSLSNGAAGTTVLSTSQPYDNLMVGNSTLGVSISDTTWTASGTTAYTALYNHGGDETPTVEMLNMWRFLQLQDRGLTADASRLLVDGDYGVGGMSIEALSKGATPSEWFNRIRTGVAASKAAAVAASGTFQIGSVSYIQGEGNYGSTDIPTLGDYTTAGYLAKLLQLYTDICADGVTAISGQSHMPAMFIDQTSSYWDTGGGGDNCTIGMAELAAPTQNPNIYVVGPYYQYTDGGAGHLDSDGYRNMGAKFAQVIHKVVDLGQGWSPLQPTSVGCRGNQILVNFHVPSPPLVFDEPYDVTTPVTFTNKGFRIKTPSHGDITIISVAIVGVASILITAAGPIDMTTNPILQYAGKAVYNGDGCLRDSDPTLADAIFSLTGQPYPLFNWCVAFQYPLVAI